MPVIIPQISDDNSICLSFGLKGCLKFKLIQVFNDGSKSDVKLIESSDNDIFYGLFDVEDVDFEIFVDNRDNDYNILFEIKLKNQLNGDLFYITRDYDQIKALETNGKHLHFIDQSSDEGKALLALSAHNSRTTIEEAASNCSRIGFAVEVENPLPKPVPVPKPRSVPVMKSEGILINLIVFNGAIGKPIIISIGLNSTVKYLKVKLEECSGIPINKICLSFGTKPLDNEKILSDYGIINGSTISLTRFFEGGGRGVVCFGQKTNANYTPYIKSYNDFIAFEEYVIKPFTIELRMRSKYSLYK